MGRKRKGKPPKNWVRTAEPLRGSDLTPEEIDDLLMAAGFGYDEKGNIIIPREKEQQQMMVWDKDRKHAWSVGVTAAAFFFHHNRWPDGNVVYRDGDPTNRNRENLLTVWVLLNAGDIL